MSNADQNQAPAAVRQTPAGAEIDLTYPVAIAGAKVATIRMRRPKVRDMLTAEKLGGSEAEREIRLFANLAEITPETVEQLDMADYAKLQGAYRGFLS